MIRKDIMKMSGMQSAADKNSLELQLKSVMIPLYQIIKES